MKKLSIYNELGRPTSITIEPIGETYDLPAQAVVELVGTFDLQDPEELEISIWDGGIAIYCPEDTIVRLDGVDIAPTDERPVSPP